MQIDSYNKTEKMVNLSRYVDPDESRDNYWWHELSNPDGLWTKPSYLPSYFMLALSSSNIYSVALMAWTKTLGMAHINPEEIWAAIWKRSLCEHSTFRTYLPVHASTLSGLDFKPEAVSTVRDHKLGTVHAGWCCWLILL